MTLRPLILATIAAVSSLFIAVPAATAQEAQATTSLNVRSGPGTGYRVVDVLQRGEVVQIDRCSGGWCRVEHTGPDGWASARYLTIYDGRAPRREPTRDRSPEIGFCIDAPNFEFGINCRPDDDDDDGRPGFERAEVCFYEHYNYRGASFCARPGQSDRSLSSTWNDRISSIEVRGNASAVVCQDFNFSGRCARVDSDISRLGPRNNDIISSYRVTR